MALLTVNEQIIQILICRIEKVLKPIGIAER